jgi:hypothetical protein
MMRQQMVLVRVLAAAGIVAASVALAACSSATQTPGASTSSGSAQMPMSPSGAMQAGSPSVAYASNVETCATCAGEGMAPMVQGSATTKGGVQVVNVGIKDGYYSPNMFMVKSGAPVRVVFTGKAAGCLAKPMFKTLNKSADFEKTGTATIDLGNLQAGTYEFTCGMGMVGGKVVVK